MPLKWRFTVRPKVVHFYMLTGSTSLGMDVQYSTRQRLHHRVYVSNTLPDKEPSQHAISGHYRPDSEMPLKWHFTVRPKVLHFYMLTGSISQGIDINTLLCIYYTNEYRYLNLHQVNLISVSIDIPYLTR